jgi:two-component system chemotaxis response regulator CheB
MVIDDSSVVRQLVQQLLAQTADIRVIGTAPDPVFALRKMQQEWPDVILLDIEMPRMDGITFLRQIMATRPTPVIMCSARAGGTGGVRLKRWPPVPWCDCPAATGCAILHEAVAELATAIRAACRPAGAARRTPGAGTGPCHPVQAAPGQSSSPEMLHDAGWARACSATPPMRY